MKNAMGTWLFGRQYSIQLEIHIHPLQEEPCLFLIGGGIFRGLGNCMRGVHFSLGLISVCVFQEYMEAA